MEQRTAIPVVNWLRSQQAVKSAVPVVVRIGRRSYNAVQYTHSENGVDETRLYVLGTLPPLHDKRRLCYRTDDSGYDWHVVAWFRQRTACAEWSEVHPFGSSHFILAPLVASGELGCGPSRKEALSPHADDHHAMRWIDRTVNAVVAEQVMQHFQRKSGPPESLRGWLEHTAPRLLLFVPCRISGIGERGGFSTR